MRLQGSRWTTYRFARVKIVRALCINCFSCALVKPGASSGPPCSGSSLGERGAVRGDSLGEERLMKGARPPLRKGCYEFLLVVPPPTRGKTREPLSVAPTRPGSSAWR